MKLPLLHYINQIKEKLGFSRVLTASGSDVVDAVNLLNSQKADKEDVALIRTGTKNTVAQIESGTYFYLDGVLKYAKSTIAVNADFTNSNCETVTAGALNNLFKLEYENLTTLNEGIVSHNDCYVLKSINVLSITLDITIGTTPISAYSVLATINKLKPKTISGLYITSIANVYCTTDQAMIKNAYAAVGGNGNVTIQASLEANKRYIIQIVAL